VGSGVVRPNARRRNASRISALPTAWIHPFLVEPATALRAPPSPTRHSLYRANAARCAALPGPEGTSLGVPTPTDARRGVGRHRAARDVWRHASATGCRAGLDRCPDRQPLTPLAPRQTPSRICRVGDRISARVLLLGLPPEMCSGPHATSRIASLAPRSGAVNNGSATFCGVWPNGPLDWPVTALHARNNRCPGGAVVPTPPTSGTFPARGPLSPPPPAHRALPHSRPRRCGRRGRPRRRTPRRRHGSGGIRASRG
jgi:hypothetical protein